MPYTNDVLKSLRGRRRAVVSHPVSGILPFSPRDLSGLKVWYSVRQEVGYTNGNALGTLVDWSGNGNNATQSTAANKPTYTTGGPNSMHYALFDTTNDNMQFGSSIALLKDHTLFAVCASTNATNFESVFGGDSATGTYGLSIQGTANKMYYSPVGYVGLTTTITLNSFYIFAVARTGIQTGNAQVFFYKNSTTATAPSEGTLGNNDQTLYALGAYNNGTAPGAFGINFCEGLIYDRRLSALEISNVFAYLNGIYTIY